MNTWNIIFMSMNYGHNADINDPKSAILEGTENFKNEIKKFPYSEYLKVSLLEFKSENQKITDLNIQNNFEKNGLNEFKNGEKLEEFNCYNIDSYTKFFSNCIKSNLPNQKYLIIFLAHSFGAGYFPLKLADNTNNHYEFFTTFELRDSIKAAFGSKPIDCFLALNCSIQSIETNIIFKDTVKLLIGSQQSLYPSQISYTALFKDLISNIDLDDRFIFTKLIYRSFNQFYSFESNKDKNFSISLTEPYNSEILRYYLNTLSAKLDLKPNKEGVKSDTEDTKRLHEVRVACEDPSGDDNISILDAEQYFFKLLGRYSDSDKKEVYQNIKLIISSLLQLKIAHLTNFNNYQNGDIEENSISENPYTSYFSSGIGLFMPKKDTEAVRQIMIIYQGLFKDSENKDFKITSVDFENIVKNSASNNHIIDEINRIKNDAKFFNKIKLKNLTSFNNSAN